MLQTAGSGLGQGAGEFGRMALGRQQRVHREGGRGSQDRADIVRIGDLVERHDQAVRGQFGNVDRRQGARLEQHALMDRVARGARRDVLGGDDFRFDAARRDLLGQTLGGGFGRIETDEFAAGRAQRGGNRVESIDAHEVGAPARLVAPGLLRSAGGRGSGFLAGRRGRRRVSDPSAAAMVLTSYTALAGERALSVTASKAKPSRLGLRICGSVWIASLLRSQ